MQLEALGSKSGVTRKASEPVLDGDGLPFFFPLKLVHTYNPSTAGG